MKRPTEPFLHVDLDAFYASVEVLKDPSLAGKPVVVGSPGPRGVVMSASYEARAAGLHSAMPSVRARRVCPEAVFRPPDFTAYRAYSNRFREILLSFTPLVEPISLDEAFLDVAGAMLLFGSPGEVAARIREAVAGELGLKCSVGVAANKLVAKLASTRAKPDGVIEVPAKETRAFLDPLPAGALWGVGEKTADTLQRLGIRTIGELVRTPPAILDRVLGDGQAHTLLELAAGRDERPVVPFEPPKSVSHEETYPRDLDQMEMIEREVLRLSHRVAGRLRAEGFRARTVTLKLRLPSFTTLTRSQTLADPTDLGSDISKTARALLQKIPPGRRRFRLIGVAGTGLIPAGAEQVSLVKAGSWQDAEVAMDHVQRRFGAKPSVMPAALLASEPSRDHGPDPPRGGGSP